MLAFRSRRASQSIKLPNHTVVYGIVLTAVGIFITLGAFTRLYELREFFPLRLPDQVNEFILNYVPFIVGVFVTTVASCAGAIVGLNWLFNGFRHMSRLRVSMNQPGEYYRPETVSFGLKEGKLQSYDHAPSLIFYIIGKIWSNARYISEIPGQIVRLNVRFIWKAVAMAIVIHFSFKVLELVPPYLASIGLGVGYVLPSPTPFYKLLLVVCVLKFIIALSLIPLRKPGASREMDSMIVEGTGHPSVFFAILEEGSKIFARKNVGNTVSRTSPTVCKDGEKQVGTLIESFPDYVKTSSRISALIALFLGSIMVVVGFLQIILMQYPSFSVPYDDFFRLYSLSLIVDLVLNVSIILFGKSFLDQAGSLLAVYRFRSKILYIEAKGDFDSGAEENLSKKSKKEEKLFNPLVNGAFNVRYFSAEAISESITPEGVRELIGLETSEKLMQEVAVLKFMPFQVKFTERYPSSWVSQLNTIDGPEENVVVVEDEHIQIDDSTGSHASVPSNA